MNAIVHIVSTVIFITSILSLNVKQIPKYLPSIMVDTQLCVSGPNLLKATILMVKPFSIL